MDLTKRGEDCPALSEKKGSVDLLKRVLAAALLGCMLAGQVCAAAEGTDGIICTSFDNQTGKMKIYGTLPSDAQDVWVTVRVFDASGEQLLYLYQTTADADLHYETELAFDVDLGYDASTPLYIVEVHYFHDGEPVKQEIYYTADKMTQLWMDIASAQSREEIGALLATVGLEAVCTELGIPAATMDGEQLAGYVYDKISSRQLQTIEDSKNCVREAVVFGNIALGGARTALSYIEENSSTLDAVLHMASTDAAYLLYEASAAKVQDAFVQSFGGYFDDGAAFADTFAFTLLLQTAKHADNMLQIVTALDTCGKTVLGDAFIQSAYAGLSASSEKNKFAAFLEQECGDVETKAQLQEAFARAESAYQSAEEEEPETVRPRPGSGGGGGGGGGTGSSGNSPSYSFPDRASSGAQANQPLITDMFTDLDSVPWAKESINTLARMDIISGRTEDIFDPDAAVTREEFVKLLVLALGLQPAGASSNFDDVKDSDWFYPYVSRAYTDGIVTGISDVFFGTGSFISREDMATMVYRALDSNGLITETEATAPFADEASIAGYAKEAVCKIAAMGIINGIGNGEFSPGRNATRAEAAKIIYAVHQLYEQSQSTEKE